MSNNKGIKLDEGKPMMSLLPSSPLLELAKVLTFGAKKYSAHQWRKGFKYSRLMDACQRHLAEYNNGNRVDHETGLSHLSHAAVNLLFLLEHEIHNLGEDDLFKGHNKVENNSLPLGWSLDKDDKSKK